MNLKSQLEKRATGALFVEFAQPCAHWTAFESN